MSERSVTFYGIKSEFFPVAFKLVEKMYAIGEHVLFLCDNDDEVSLYSSKLWTFSRLSFIPSGNAHTLPVDDAKFCHTWFSTDIVFHNEPVCLLHNGLNIFDVRPPLERLRKVIDVFNLEFSPAAKIRAAAYQGEGFLEQKVWLQSDNGWTQGEL
ncbi:MAG: DNA polymerase III subunit chi [Alphaproteobacteria bacterium]|nr:DNA polymerase III subunit chi [Alphaproteobacteria bacterium]